MNIGESYFDVLILDDDEKNRILLKKQLQIRGVKAQTASDIAEIQKALNTTHPKVLIIDYFLGDTKATDVLKELKDSHNIKNILVIIYTAEHISDSEKTEFERIYECKLLDKLSDSNMLYELIRKKLNE